MKRDDLTETPEEQIRVQSSRNGIVVFETITQSFLLAHLTYDFDKRYGPQAVEQLDRLLIDEAFAKTNLEKNKQQEGMKIYPGPKWFGLCCDSATPSRDPATKILDADVVESIEENGALSSFDADTGCMCTSAFIGNNSVFLSSSSKSSWFSLLVFGSTDPFVVPSKVLP